jgi:hypothetical protein
MRHKNNSLTKVSKELWITRRSRLPSPGSADKGAAASGREPHRVGIAFGRAMMPFFADCCFGVAMCNSNARDWPSSSMDAISV